MSDSETIELFVRCLCNPTVRSTVTFQHFLTLIDKMSAKIKAGEQIEAETAEMIALRPAIEAEIELLAGKNQPQ